MMFNPPGLQDVTATEILSKQSVVSAGRFKPDSPLGSPLLTKSSHHSKLVDKTTLTTFKRPTRGMAPTLQSPRSMQNGANSDSDSADKSKDDGDNDGESNSVGTRRTKRGRGRPPKNRNASSSKDSAKGKEDPYEFEEDSNDGHDRSDRKRKSKASNHDDDDDDDEDQAEEETRSRRDRGSRHGISGKEVISVKCQVISRPCSSSSPGVDQRFPSLAERVGRPLRVQVRERRQGSVYQAQGSVGHAIRVCHAERLQWQKVP